MSIDSALSSNMHRKKSLELSLSQSDNYPYTKHSLKQSQQRSRSNKRTMSVSEEISGDILTDLTSMPLITSKQDNHKRNRRFSDLKSSSGNQKSPVANSDRRNSTSQISFSSLLPNPFRSNKHHHKNTTKDETNTSINALNNNSSLYSNDMMTMKTEPPSSLKLSNTNISGSHTSLSSFAHEDNTSSLSSSASSLFILDPSESEPRSTETFVSELHTSLCVGEIYREHFFDCFHTNYCGEFEQEGPFITSLRYFYTKPTIIDNGSLSIDNCLARALIRIPSRNYDVSEMVTGTNEDNILQVLFNKAHLSAIHTCKTIGDPKANEKIYLFDKSNDERQNCKIGLIYQGTDQKDEYGIFSNDDLSDDMLNFLQLLSDRVRLKGFTKYRADLDTKDDLHGEYSYYTQYKNHEMMFNVAPIIPSTKANGQCIERKGLVGNSFVCIVFQESDTEFKPDFISGKVTQVYITVQPIHNDDELYYKIAIWHRNDVTSIIKPPGGIYQCGKSFRDYFLILLLNSINAAIESPNLRSRIAEPRQKLKKEELKILSLNLSTKQIVETAFEVDTIPLQPETRPPVQRLDSIAVITPQLTNDSAVVPNPGRTSPVATKKRGFSRIFGVFSGSRSGSISSSSLTPSTSSFQTYNDISPVSQNSPPLPEPTVQSRTVIPANKEPVKRATSLKFRPAPAPPVPPRPPTSKQQSISSGPSPSPPLTSTRANSIDSSNDSTIQPSSLPRHGILSSTVLLDSTVRTRSNSSPDDAANTTKPQSLAATRISEEIDYINSSTDDDNFDEESSEDELVVGHRTLIDPPPLILSTNTTS